jgi:aconitate hydratase
MPFPVIPDPAEYFVDDSLFEYPTYTAEPVFGPNFGQPATTPEPCGELSCRVAAVLGDNITTDHILPLGTLMKYRSNIPKYSEYVFSGVVPDFAAHCAAIKAEGMSAVVVGGFGYGQGSSREHAAICPMFLGVRAILAKSMERIHRANLINFGILPLLFANPDDQAGIMLDDVLIISDVEKIIYTGTGNIYNRTKESCIDITLELSPRQKDILRIGGMQRFVVNSN